MRGKRFVLGMVGAAVIASAGVVAGLSVASSGKIADGIHVREIALGGLTAEQARARIERELVEPLERPIAVTRRDVTYRLSAKEAKLDVDVEAVVQTALDRSAEANPVTAAWRTLTGRHPSTEIPIEVTIDPKAARRFADRVRVAIDRPAIEPELEFHENRPKVAGGQNGMAVDRARLRELIEQMAADPGRRVRTVPVRSTKPKQSTRAFKAEHETIITVDRSTNELRLFKKFKQVKKYAVAVGAQGHETPAGTYAITNKAINPAWHVPNSAWAGDLAGTVVPPGPSNPLKARWMGFYDGAGIHGTADRGSIGSNASHGCVRMLEEDVIDLYDRVPVGATIHVV